MEQWVIFVDYRLKPSTMVHTFIRYIYNKLDFKSAKTDFISLCRNYVIEIEI